VATLGVAKLQNEDFSSCGSKTLGFLASQGYDVTASIRDVRDTQWTDVTNFVALLTDGGPGIAEHKTDRVFVECKYFLPHIQ